MRLYLLLFTLLVLLFNGCETPDQNIYKLLTDRHTKDSVQLHYAREILQNRVFQNQERATKAVSYLILATKADHDSIDVCREKAISLSEKAYPTNVYVWTQLAKNDRKRKKFKAATQGFETALELAGNQGDSFGDSVRASLLNSLGITYLLNAQYAPAKESLKQANYLNLKRKSWRQAAAVYNNLGLIGEKTARFGQSIHHYEQAILLRKQDTNWLETAKVLKNIGIVYNKLGQYDQSLPYLSEAIATLQQMPVQNQKEQASALNSLGVTHYKLKHYEKALDYYQQSLALRLEMGHVPGIAGSLNNLSNLFKSINLPDSALRYQQKAIQLKKQHRLTSSLLTNYKNLGELFMDLGDLEASEAALDSAAAYQNKENNHRLDVSVKLSKARLLILRKEFVGAVQELNECMALMEQQPINDLLLEAYDLYRNTYFAWEDAPKAQLYDQQYDSLDDVIFKEQQRKINIMQASLKDERLAHLLQQHQIEQELASIERNRLINSLIVIFAAALLSVAGLFIYRKRFRNMASSDQRKADAIDELEMNVQQLREQHQDLEEGINKGLAFFSDKVFLRHFNENDKIISLLYKDIVLIRMVSDHMYWYTRKNDHYIIRQKLKDYVEDLAYYGLVRCHKSWIVNRSFVLEYRPTGKYSGEVKIKTPIEVRLQPKDGEFEKKVYEWIPVSKTYLKDWEDFTSRD